MSFQEKSTLGVLVAFVAIFGWYFADLFRTLGNGEVADLEYQGPLLVMAVLFVVLVVATHIVMALADPRGADQTDERDRLIERTGEYIGGFALGTGALVALALAMLEVAHFYIAHAILASLVLSEIVSGVSKLVMYRRGI